MVAKGEFRALASLRSRSNRAAATCPCTNDTVRSASPTALFSSESQSGATAVAMTIAIVSPSTSSKSVNPLPSALEVEIEGTPVLHRPRLLVGIYADVISAGKE